MPIAKVFEGTGLHGAVVVVVVVAVVVVVGFTTGGVAPDATIVAETLRARTRTFGVWCAPLPVPG